jgi:hypothetical protein
VAASFDAKGDLLAGTGAGAFDQLTVAATNGYVLTVNSATATGLEWAATNPGGHYWRKPLAQDYLVEEHQVKLLYLLILLVYTLFQHRLHTLASI